MLHSIDSSDSTQTQHPRSYLISTTFHLPSASQIFRSFKAMVQNPPSKDDFVIPLLSPHYNTFLLHTPLSTPLNALTPMQHETLPFDHHSVVPFHPDELRAVRNLYRTSASFASQNKAQPSTALLPRASPDEDTRRAWKLHRVVAGHTGIIHCIAADPNNVGIDLSSDSNFQEMSSGNLFYTAGADCTIKCWEGLMGSCQLTLTGHTAGIHALATSSAYPYIFSAGEDRDIRIWDLQGGGQQSADGPVSAAKLSGSVNQTVAKLHGSLGCVEALKAHPRVPYLLVSGGSDGAVRVWDIRCNQCVQAFFGHEGTVETICVQPTEPQILTGGSDGTVRLWDLTAGKCGSTAPSKQSAFKYHSRGVRASFLHPTEFVYTSLSSDSTRFWQLPDGKHLRQQSGFTLPRTSSMDSLYGASLSESGAFYVTGHASGAVRFHDWHSGQCYLELFEQSTADIERRIAAGGPSGADSFDVQQQGVLATALNARDNLLLTGLRDKTIHLYINQEM